MDAQLIEIERLVKEESLILELLRTFRPSDISTETYNGLVQHLMDIAANIYYRSKKVLER